ncbi:hypothetical protein DFH09DRAFT_1315534 [Mycena vulgaris]|nr:hypothetical protein DFH09DRAFT_1315534 [Mycena vulgaris]
MPDDDHCEVKITANIKSDDMRRDYQRRRLLLWTVYSTRAPRARRRTTTHPPHTAPNVLRDCDIGRDQCPHPHAQHATLVAHVASVASPPTATVSSAIPVRRSNPEPAVHRDSRRAPPTARAAAAPALHRRRRRLHRLRARRASAVRTHSFEPKWFWNNHIGGFIKFALAEGHPAKVDNAKGKDVGDKHVCVGKNITIPNWVADSDYVLSFSCAYQFPLTAHVFLSVTFRVRTAIGGFHSNNVPTKQLPLYHNCANIRIQGGVPLEPKPANWVAPFIGGSQDPVNGKPIPADTCGFKKFVSRRDPSVVDVNDVSPSNIAFGIPDGWAVPGGTLQKRLDTLILPRLGHAARAVRELDN